jgi:hypothetical protein
MAALVMRGVLRYYIPKDQELIMHDHSHTTPPRQRRLFSLAQQGIGVRVGIALALVALIWAALLPLVA